MKIYKVELDARNPIEKIVKVPYNSEYNLEISWCGKLFPSSSSTGIALKASVGGRDLCFVGIPPCSHGDYSTYSTGFAHPCTNSTVLPVVTKDRPEITYIPNIPVKNFETGYWNYDVGFNPIKVVGIDEDYYEITGESTLQNITTNECSVIIAPSKGDSIKIELCTAWGEILLASDKLKITPNTLMLKGVKIDIDKLIADYKKS
jgi:hypothetical protein